MEFHKTVLSKGFVVLVTYMDPLPVLDILQGKKALTFMQCRDIKVNVTCILINYTVTHMDPLPVLDILQGKKALTFMQCRDIKVNVTCILINYTVTHMDPLPVLDILQGKKALTFMQCRDIKELQRTSDKNRELLEKIRPMAETSYTIFKDALRSTGQPLLVQYLECIEKKEDTKDIENELETTICLPIQFKVLGDRDKLIDVYSKDYLKTELSPLMPEEQFHVDKLYVPFKMDIIVKRNTNYKTEEQKKEDEKKNQVKTYRDIFYDNGHLLNTVFLSGDPGVGKTTFCRKLISDWCRAHTSKQNEKDNDTDNVSNKCSDVTTDKCADTSGDECVDTNSDECVDTTGDKCAAATSDKCADATTDKCANTTSDKCADATTDKCANTTSDKCADTTGDKCAAATSDKCVDTTTDKSADTTSDKCVDTTSDKCADTTSDKCVDTTSDKCTDATSDKCVDTTTDKSADTTSDKCVDTTSDKCADTTSDKCVDTTSDKCTDATTDEYSDTTSDKCVDTTSDKCVDTTSDKCADATGDKCADTTSDKSVDTTSDKCTDATTDEYSDTSSDEYSDTTSDECADTTSDILSDTTSDEYSDTSSDEYSDTTSNRCADDFDEENVNTMKLFDFLFFVSLRHCSDEAFIEEMIINQLNLDKDSVDHILGSAQFKCLVVLDGLDEWSPPTNIQYNPRDVKGLPKTNHTGVFYSLVTTRPWKLVLIPQACTRNYREIKITGVQGKDSTKLVELFLMHSGYSDCAEKLSQDFRSEIESKNLLDLSTIPLVLKLLLCQWLETKTLKTSKCQVYGDVIELMIVHALNKNEDDVELRGKITLLSQTCKSNPLPTCLSEQTFAHLNSFSAILLNVGKLSFHTLFSDTNKAKLIFRDQDLKKYDLDLELCLKLGILSQRPNLGKSLVYRERTITFLHKSFQEFYAALYISHTSEECLPQIKDKCSDSNSILEMSNVFQFLSGMNPQCMTKVHEHIGELPVDYSRIWYAISDMILNSAVESLSCNHTDFTIKIRFLVIYTRMYIRCIDYICFDYLRGIELIGVSLTHTQITHLLTDSPHIRKVALEYVDCKADSKCGCLTSASDQVGGEQSLLEIHMTEYVISRGNGMFNHIHSYPELQVLDLSYIQLTHTQISHLLTDAPHTCIRKVALWYVACKVDSECGCLTSAIDQVGDEQSLLEIHTGNMAICVSHMTECTISRGSGMFNHIHSYPELQVLDLLDMQLTHTQITHLLTNSPHIRKVTLQDVDCEADGECGCLTSASDQVGCEQYLLEIHTGNMALCVSHMTECTISRGSGMFNHIHSYPELQGLSLSDIQLTHTQITHLLTDSPHLRKVTLQDVDCKADSECGCLTSASDQVGGEQSLLEIHTGNMATCVSHMTECTFYRGSGMFYPRGSGMFNHIHSYPELQVLDLSHVQLTHTQISHLLTDSPHIRKVTLRDVDCKADSECGCLTSASDQVGEQSLLEIHTGNMALCVSHMTKCTIDEGSEIFNHIHTYPELQVLSLSAIQLTHTQITHLLTDSPHIRKVTLRDVDCKADSECGCLISAIDQVGCEQSLLEIHTGNIAICVSHMTKCTIYGGSQLFSHISETRSLEMFKSRARQETDVADSLRLLKSSLCLQEVTFNAYIEPNGVYPDCPFILSQETLRTILQGLSESHGVKVTFKMMKLSSGDANTARDMVTAQGKFKILHENEKSRKTDLDDELIGEESTIFTMKLELHKE